MIVTDLKILKSKSLDLDDAIDSLYDIIKELEINLEESEIEGAGLSAIQIGLPTRVCIIRTKKLSLDLYNSEIISGSEPIVFKGEGCLSIPNKYIDTHRMNNITVKNGDGREYNLEGFEAVVVQHELDHWDGILMLDRRVV